MADPQAAGSGERRQVHVSQLKLTDFRNYRRLSLDLAPGPVVLTGENGAGKTNLLEALSFLTPGRGLRRAAYGDVGRASAGNGFAVHATVSGPFGACEIGTGTVGNAPDESARKVRIQGAPARSAEALLEWLRVMWLTPAMDSLFTGPAAERRRFLDRLVLVMDGAHGRRTLDYEKAMRARNRLLADESRDTAWFEAIETQMAETGVAIAAARAEIVRLLSGMIERLPSDTPFPQADLVLGGIFEAEIANRRPAVDVEEMFRASLSANRTRDRIAGRTLEGPHRTDLIVRHRPKDQPAEHSSTGEQKALLIGIILSHARLSGELTGAAPIMLLDEIAAHLDSSRRAALFSILDELNCQYVMTGTEATLFKSLRDRAQFLAVSNGEVTADADNLHSSD